MKIKPSLRQHQIWGKWIKKTMEEIDDFELSLANHYPKNVSRKAYLTNVSLGKIRNFLDNKLAGEHDKDWKANIY